MRDTSKRKMKHVWDIKDSLCLLVVVLHILGLRCCLQLVLVLEFEVL